MPFVVDASVVGSWLLPDEDHPEAVILLEKLKDDEAFAPSLLWFELRNLLLANERRERITPTQTAAALNLFQELPLRFDSQPDSNTTLQLAREHRLSVYDAVYLELAIRRHLPLLTFDAQLAEAAKACTSAIRPVSARGCRFNAMRLVHLIAGTGSFFCGTGLRDHALVEALRRLGHDAHLGRCPRICRWEHRCWTLRELHS